MTDDLRKIYRSDGAVRPSRGTFCTEEEGRTKQEEANAADINVLLPKLVLGFVPHMRTDGVFADVSQIGDFHSALEQVREAEYQFGLQPAAVRSAFGNDMGAFVDAFKSEEGIAKLRELKVVPETEATLADRREAASEERAARRALDRERKRRVEEAARDAPPIVPKV